MLTKIIYSLKSLDDEQANEKLADFMGEIEFLSESEIEGHVKQINDDDEGYFYIEWDEDKMSNERFQLAAEDYCGNGLEIVSIEEDA